MSRQDLFVDVSEIVDEVSLGDNGSGRFLFDEEACLHRAVIGVGVSGDFFFQFFGEGGVGADGAPLALAKVDAVIITDPDEIDLGVLVPVGADIQVAFHLLAGVEKGEGFLADWW